jgi:hypothetical protein
MPLEELFAPYGVRNKRQKFSAVALSIYSGSDSAFPSEIPQKPRGRRTYPHRSMIGQQLAVVSWSGISIRSRLTTMASCLAVALNGNRYMSMRLVRRFISQKQGTAGMSTHLLNLRREYHDVLCSKLRAATDQPPRPASENSNHTHSQQPNPFQGATGFGNHRLLEWHESSPVPTKSVKT